MDNTATPDADIPDQDTSTDALVPTSKPKRKKPKVDIREHRRGMPVRDNLLE
ncbi:MAG: hypothetical protein AAFS10_12835 [Myxococcota bacterium]